MAKHSSSTSTTLVLLAVLFLLGTTLAITEISRITYPAQQFITPGNFFGSDYLAVALFNPEYNNQSLIESVRVFDSLSFIPEKEQKGFLGVEATNSLRKFAYGADEETSKVVYFANAKQNIYKILLQEDGAITQAAVAEVADQCTQISNLWTRNSRVYYACRAEQEFLIFAHDAADLRKLSSITAPSSSLLKAFISPATGSLYYVEASGSPVSGITEVVLKRIAVDDATEENLGVVFSRDGPVDEIYSMMFDSVNDKIFLNIDAKLFKLSIQNSTVEVEAVIEVPNQKAPEQHDVYSVMKQAPQQDIAVLVYQDTANQFAVAKISLKELALQENSTVRNDNVEYTKLEDIIFADAGTFVVVFQNMISKHALSSVNCPAGQVFHRKNACAECEAGHFRNDTAAYPLDICLVCPVGTFASKKGTVECHPCPTALTAGSTTCPDDPQKQQRGLITLLVVSGICVLVIVVGLIVGFLLLFRERAKRQQSQYDEVQ